LLLAAPLRPGFAWAEGDGESPELFLFRERILLKRINHTLGYRLDGLKRCARRTRGPAIDRLAARLELTLRSNDTLTGEVIRLLSCPKGGTGSNLEDIHSLAQVHRALPVLNGTGTYYTPGILEMMRLFSETERLRVADCARELNEAVAKQRHDERKPFRTIKRVARIACGIGHAAKDAFTRRTSPSGCQRVVEEITHGIDPHCFTPNERNWTADGSQGYFDANPCYAADRYIDGAITADHRMNSSLTTQGLQSFVYLLGNQIQEKIARKETSIDLAATFKSAGVQATGLASPKMMMGYLAYLYGAEKSLVGRVDSYADEAWQSALREGLSPNDARKLYNERKRLLDFFRDVRELALSKKMRLTIGGTDVSTYHRHQFTAAYLACHYQSSGDERMARSMPRMIGVAYESKDFVSHIREGLSFADSRKNFSQDTSKYSEGGRLGIAVCRSEFGSDQTHSRPVFSRLNF